MSRNLASDQRRGGRGTVAGRKRRRLRPTVLVLEGRTLLSTYTVTLATDPATITVAELDLFRRMGNMMVLKSWDLEPRARFGAVDPYDRFLAERYAYWSDDVPHEDPFPGP